MASVRPINNVVGEYKTLEAAINACSQFAVRGPDGKLVSKWRAVPHPTSRNKNGSPKYAIQRS